MSFAFYKAYRRLNLFLMVFCICPFLQCKHTNRFICKPKYLRLVCISPSIYLVFVVCLSAYGMPSLLNAEPTVFNILELVHLLTTSYYVFFVIAFLLLKRHWHAAFFNRLNQFDRTYNKFVAPPIRYKHINRTFWIEVCAFGTYEFLKPILQYTFEPGLVGDLSGNAILLNSYVEQFIYAIVLFHIKNCAHHLIVRLRKIDALLNRCLVKHQQKTNITKYPTANFQLEQMALMFTISLKARHSLQRAFGPTFVLIFTFNLFSIAFIAYRLLNMNAEHPEYNGRSAYATALDVGIVLPCMFKDFYCMINYHIMGNMVSNGFIRFHLWQRIQLKRTLCSIY